MSSTSNRLTPMQEELLNRADSILNQIGSAASKAGDFAAEQLPDIATQFITFGRATSTMWVALGIGTIITSIVLAVKIWRNADGDEPLAIFMMVPGSLGVMVFSLNVHAFLMSWFAPKLYLITEIVKVIK